MKLFPPDNDSIRLFKRHYAFIVLLSAVSLIALLFIPTFLVSSSTEAREIHIAQLMSDGHSMILPLRNGVVPSKPPLFHWLAVLNMHVFSVAAATASRLVSVTSAVVILILFYLSMLGAKNVQSAKRYSVAFLGAGILVSFPMFTRLLLDARVDMLFSLGCFGAWLASNQFSKRNVWLFWLSIAVAIIVKGPLGIVLPLLLCGSRALWLSSFRDFLRFFYPASRPLLFLLIPLSWYLLAAYIGGGEFIWRVSYENINRFITEDHKRILSPIIYLKAYLVKLAPWSWIALFYLVRDVRSCLAGRTRSARQAHMLAFLVGLVFFCVSIGKRPSYLLPLLPLLAAYIAQSILYSPKVITAWRSKQVSKFYRWMLLMLLGGVASLVIPVIMTELFFTEYRSYLTYLVQHRTIICLCFCFCALLVFWQKTHARGLCSYCALIIMIYAIGIGVKGDMKDFEAMASKINAVVPRDESLVILKGRHDEYFDPLQLLLSRTLLSQYPDEILDCKSWYLIQEQNLGAVSNYQLEFDQSYFILGDRRKARYRRDIHLFRCRK